MNFCDCLFCKGHLWCYVRVCPEENILEGNIVLPPTVWNNLCAGNVPMMPKNAAYVGSSEVLEQSHSVIG